MPELTGGDPAWDLLVPVEADGGSILGRRTFPAGSHLLLGFYIVSWDQPNRI